MLSHIVAGIVCYLIGFGFLALILLGEERTGVTVNDTDVAPFALILFCVEWLLAGAWLTELHRLWMHRIPKLPINWEAFWPALIMVTAPIMGMSIAITDPSSNVEGIPLSVPIAAFLTFLFGGLYLFNHHVIIRREHNADGSLFDRLLVALLVTFFAGTAAGVTLSSVEEMPNWIVLPGAVLLILMAGGLWYRLVVDLVRRWRENSTREEPTP
jgi:hypothetical protein